MKILDLSVLIMKTVPNMSPFLLSKDTIGIINKPYFIDFEIMEKKMGAGGGSPQKFFEDLKK